LKRLVHCIIGSTLGLLVSSDKPFIFPYLVVIGWIGGWIPDLDLRIKHRKSLHNIWIAVFSAAILYMITSYIYNYLVLTSYITKSSFLEKTVIVFLGAWILHILCDSLTIRGVYPFYPLSNYRLRIAKLRSNGLAANAIGLAIALVFFILWLRSTKLIVYIEYLERLIGLKT